MNHVVALPLAAALLATGVHAQVPLAAVPAPMPVAVIVKVPKPWYAPRALVLGKMRDTIPQYASIPGLTYKMFSFAQADGQYGGIYLWQDRAAAQGWFSPAWFERVKSERGVDGNVRYFDVPVALDNVQSGAPGAVEGNAISTLVTLPVPPGVDRARIIAEFRAAIPVHRKVPGLMRKYFVITDDGRFGGIYLWDTQASAEQWFNEAWHARVRTTYGADAALEWFDTPILLPTTLADNRIAMAQP
jgi:heme-degrading monooxygenase HmoA